MNEQFKIRILDIIRGTTVDGPGFRTAIYMAGCKHKCPGCHNPGSWDFNSGKEMSLEEIVSIVRTEDFDVTITGGDPLCSPFSTLQLVKSIKEAGYAIWLYTGYVYEDIIRNDELKEILNYIDVVVDGPFIESKKDLDLKFRGSSNQRIIHIKAGADQEKLFRNES